jgi:hypothetical protein
MQDLLQGNLKRQAQLYRQKDIVNRAVSMRLKNLQRPIWNAYGYGELEGAFVKDLHANRAHPPVSKRSDTCH